MREKLLFLRVEHDAHPVAFKSCVEKEKEKRREKRREKEEREKSFFF